MSDKTIEDKLKWLGALYTSKGINELVINGHGNGLALASLFYRHAIGDWGDLEDEDYQLNNEMLIKGGRILSAYQFEGVEIWIITEADRARTTALLPSEY
ncbi:hypothetical protein G3488_17320 [Shewanella baltica]|uniref:hypothetical protein n=1 Tax=Shewanella baltica TaxID=62322 RepID=UPI00217E96C6|nr:hypothetical protein [Shewanella baltica]MCS6097679.1 hypothetical protein [Shewanella baltica]MCS6228787.1 hypothetical protein [Shewanella baltica]MCS6232608.1 hypothetical protein [Shewanella baltica]